MDINKPGVLYLPKTLEGWPWPREINPHYKEIKEASNTWFRGFNAFSPESQHAFDKCDFCLLPALVYPWASKEHLRTGCDLMNLFFVVDEYTDSAPAPAVRQVVDIVKDAVNNPHKPRPDGETILGKIAQEFWQLGSKTATPTSQCHMVESFTAYLESVVQQAYDRDNGVFRTVESYLEKRRLNIGARPSFVPLELDLNLPDYIFYHPILVELSGYIVDMIIFDNDLVSYNKEQALGDDQYNIITLSMRQFQFDLPEAFNWLADLYMDRKTKFLEGLKRLPSWGPEMDNQVQQYVHGLANWARGHDCWNFESGRYFGSQGRDIQISRTVSLLPKQAQTQVKILKSPCRDNVVVPLIDALDKGLDDRIKFFVKDVDPDSPLSRYCVTSLI